MRRKIIKHGTATLSVSLPSSWAKRFNLKKGDEVQVEERGNQLVIVGSGQETERKVGFLELKDKSKFARRLIYKFYKSGYDELKIKYSDPGLLVLIQNALEESPGFEIVDQGKDFVRVKNISIGLDEEFDALLNRMFILIILMGRDVIEGIKKKDNVLISNVISYEANLQKLDYFCERHLYTKGYQDYSKTLFLYSDVRTLEQIGDVLRDLGMYLSNTEIPLTRFIAYVPKSKDFVLAKDIRISKECVKSFEELISIIEFVHKNFRKFDSESTLEFKYKILNLQKSMFDNMPKYNLNEIIISHYLISVIYLLRHINEVT